jgi:hypothetical protein
MQTYLSSALPTTAGFILEPSALSMPRAMPTGSEGMAPRKFHPSVDEPFRDGPGVNGMCRRRRSSQVGNGCPIVVTYLNKRLLEPRGLPLRRNFSRLRLFEHLRVGPHPYSQSLISLALCSSRPSFAAFAAFATFATRTPAGCSGTLGRA